MARVSQAHLDARRQQILDAARRCFIRNGFHTTSMQDVLGEADLSAGAVYRYFRSKEDIIVAIATDTLTTLTRAFEALTSTAPLPPLDEAFGAIFATLERLDQESGIGGLVVQVWGEALRSPTLRERVTLAFSNEIRHVLVHLVEAYQAQGSLPGGVPPEQIARTLAALVPGFLIQRVLLGDVDAAMFRAGLRALLGSARHETAPGSAVSPPPPQAAQPAPAVSGDL